MFRKLDGRVKRWATLNEPWVVTDGGYLHGALAPGHSNLFEAPIASRNLMLAHGSAVQRYRQVGKHEIGLVVNLEPKFPATDSESDRKAATRADAYMNRQYLDPAFGLGCPPEMAEIFGPAWRDWTPDELALAAQPIDWLGINYYTRGVMKHDDRKPPVRADYVRQPHATYTETGWEVFEQGLTDTLLWVKQRYGNPPVYITENGAAFYDPPTAIDGRVEDPLRVSYLKRHLRAGPRRDRQGRGRPRLYDLVAARQSRMVARLFQAVRHRPRRFRNAGADAKDSARLLFAGDRQQRRRTRRLRALRHSLCRGMIAKALRDAR